MFYIGDKVYPANKKLFEDCTTSREEMEHLQGFITEVDKTDYERTYEVTWIDNRTGEEAEFDHGLKSAWWDDEELTHFYNDYIIEVNEFFNNDADLEDSDIDMIVDNAVDYLINVYLETELADYGIKSNNQNYDDIVDKILERISKRLN